MDSESAKLADRPTGERQSPSSSRRRFYCTLGGVFRALELCNLVHLCLNPQNALKGQYVSGAPSLSNGRF